MIPQNSPFANYLRYKHEIDTAVHRVLNSGHYVMGGECAAFEREFAEYIGVKHAVTAGSGTEALHLMLRASGVGPGDEVITVSHTAVATIAAIGMCGAVPVFVDINPDTYTINPEYIHKAVNRKTKAVVGVHLYGHPSPIGPILEIVKKYNLLFFEDCAQSHGAAYRGRKTGSWGHAAVFSFYPTKNLGALGDGGAITTNNSELNERLRAIRQYGWDRNRISRTAGYNSRLDEIQAAVLRVKLKHLDSNNKTRQDISETYGKGLAGLNLRLPTTSPEAIHVFHQYVVQCRDKASRDGLKEYLQTRNIRTAIHYPVPVHFQPAYSAKLGDKLRLPVTERITRRILSLPMFPEISGGELNTIIKAIHDFFGLGI